MRIEPGGEAAVVIQTSDEGETRALAARLGAGFVGGEIVGLRGDLGAGKTVFVQGLARGLGSDDPVTSPTFVIVHQYHGRLTLFHVDLYRLEGEQVEGLGLDELIAPDTVVAVEWSDRLPARLRRRLWLEIAMEFGGREHERKLRISTAAGATTELSDRVAAALGRDDPAAGPAETT